MPEFSGSRAGLPSTRPAGSSSVLMQPHLDAVGNSRDTSDGNHGEGAPDRGVLQVGASRRPRARLDGTGDREAPVDHRVQADLTAVALGHRVRGDQAKGAVPLQERGSTEEEVGHEICPAATPFTSENDTTATPERFRPSRQRSCASQERRVADRPRRSRRGRRSRQALQAPSGAASSVRSRSGQSE